MAFWGAWPLNPIYLRACVSSIEGAHTLNCDNDVMGAVIVTLQKGRARQCNENMHVQMFKGHARGQLAIV